MPSRRVMAIAFGLGRLAIGLPLLARPLLAQHWLGPAAASDAAQAMARGVAGRDVALGAGLLAAIARGEGVAIWLAAGAVADAADVVATVVAGDALPTRPRVGTIALAGGAAVAGAVLVSAYRSDR